MLKLIQNKLLEWQEYYLVLQLLQCVEIALPLPQESEFLS